MSFKLLLLVSVMMAASSNSCLMLWVSMEMNMLAFLPLMCMNINSSLESSLKYFLVQSLGSAVFLFLILTSITNINNSPMMILIMVLKLGGAPLHGWFVSLLTYIGPKLYLVLATLQKVIPFIVISMILVSKLWLMLMMLMNMLIIFTKIMTMDMMGILAYSSINSINWLLVSMLTSYGLFMLFMFLYFILLLGVIIYTMIPGSISFTNLYMMSSINKTMFIFTFMSLGSVPPFMGFIAKMMVIKMSMMWINSLMMLIMLFSSFMVLFMYMSYTHIGLTYHPYYSSQISTKSLMSLKQMYFLTLWSIWLITLFIV